MTPRKTLLLVSALLGTMGLILVLALPVRAGGPWSIESVECQVDTKTITVSGTVNSINPTIDDIYYNGRLVYSENVQTDDMGEGKAAYVLKRPFVQLGGEVRVTNRDSGDTIVTICHNAVPLNHGHGDRWAVLYIDQDIYGDPSVKVYCIINAQGQFGGEFTRAEFRALPRVHPEPILLKLITTCEVPVAVYELASGERQVNIGPDAEGKTAVMVFSKMPPVNIHFYDIDPNLPVWY